MGLASRPLILHGQGRWKGQDASRALLLEAANATVTIVHSFSTNAKEQQAILAELQKRTQRRPVGLLSGSAIVGTSTGILGD